MRKLVSGDKSGVGGALTFGIIKSVMGFRQLMLRGLEKVGHEWTLVCLAWNLKRMAILRPSCAQSG